MQSFRVLVEHLANSSATTTTPRPLSTINLANNLIEGKVSSLVAKLISVRDVRIDLSGNPISDREVCYFMCVCFRHFEKEKGSCVNIFCLFFFYSFLHSFSCLRQLSKPGATILCAHVRWNTTPCLFFKIYRANPSISSSSSSSSNAHLGSC